MKPTHKVTSRKKTDIDPSALLLLSVCFAVGAIIGCIAVSAVSNNGYVALSGYIQDFVKSIQGDNLYLPNLFSVIWSVLRWPLFAWLLSYFALGVIGIPILFMVRGFLLAFCISSFVRVLGQAGILFMCMMVGLESFLTIPILFIIGTQGYLLAVQRRRERGGSKGKSSIKLFDFSKPFEQIACLSVLGFCVIWEMLFVPMLVSGVSHLIVLS